jgi:hypothetical protein
MPFKTNQLLTPGTNVNANTIASRLCMLAWSVVNNTIANPMNPVNQNKGNNRQYRSEILTNRRYRQGPAIVLAFTVKNFG